MRLLCLLVVMACSPMVYTHGVPNLADVDGPSVWRSGQISTREGWLYIEQIAGDRRVHIIKLNFDKEGSDTIAASMGFDVNELPIQPEGDQDVFDDAIGTLRSPDPAATASAVKLLEMCRSHPDTDFCLVHCTHGQDRTGFVVGEYRVDRDGWTKEQAYKEMLAHHFHWELVGLSIAWERYRAPVR